MRPLRLSLDSEQITLLDRFRRLVLAENRVQNLTTIESDFDFATRHVLDSLTCLTTGLLPGTAGTISGLGAAGGGTVFRLVDVGTGAGFPGVPLKVARPWLEVTLLDPLRKRTAFLQHVVASLGLPGCPVVCERAEVAGRQPGRRETYDLAVLRAVAPLPVDLEYGLPFVRPGGYLLAMKGPKVAEEMREAEWAAGQLGGVLESRIDLTLPLTDERRCLVVFRKVAPTPPEFPRRDGLPARRPLGRD